MSKITKSAVVVLIALALSVVFAFTTAFASGISFKAFAATAEETVTMNTGVTDYVKYGGTFNVDSTATVKTPGGKEISGQTEIKADEIGIYEVTYTSSGTNAGKYTYNVECYIEYEYKLVVDNYGATIPTYWEKGGDNITLPGATLYYNDEDLEKWLPANDGSEVWCRVTKPGSASVEKKLSEFSESEKTITPDTEGIYFFTYFAKLAGGKNIISEEYTMQVQSTFSDTSAPTLVVSGMPSSASVGTQVSLPTATVTDDYDTRVYTEIRVTHDYGNGVTDVKDVVIDEKTGYAKKDSQGNTLYYKKATNGGYEYSGTELVTTTNPEEAVAVKFDNVNFMSFYPSEEGTYTVVYSAKDNTGYYSGDNGLANSTTQRTYQVSVSDTTAPVYDELDSSLIPSQWGYYGVNRKTVEGDVEYPTDDYVAVDSTDIQFPIPELYDNKDNASSLRASFTITDPSNKTVMTFRNILSTEASGDCSYTPANYGDGTRTYYFFRYWESTTEYTVDENSGKISGGNIGDNAYSLVYYDESARKVTKGFFNFSNYKPVGTSAIGSYTVTYVARDVKGNGSTQSFNIDLQSTFTDQVAPTVDFDAPKYFAFTSSEKEVKIEDVAIRDTQDSRLDVKYYIIVNKNSNAATDFDTLVSGLTEGVDYFELDHTSGTNTFTLVRDGGNKLTVTDKDGVDHDVTVSESTVYVAAKAVDAVGNANEKIAEINILDATADKDATTAFGTLTSGDAVVGEQYILGSATVQFAAGDRNYTGFELYVQRIKDGSGNLVDDEPMSGVSFETYSDNGSSPSEAENRLHIDNIRFTPYSAGVYMVVLRGYYISGKSQTKMAFVTANSGSGSGGAVASSVGLPTTMEYGQTYELKDSYNTNLSGNVGILHSITGGRIRVMGNEVTAYSTGYYTFKDYTFTYESSITGTNDNIGAIKYDLTGNTYNGIASPNEHKGTQISQVSDTQTITLNLQGAMPTYTELFSDSYGENVPNIVVLPNVSASSRNGNATDLKITVTDPDGVDMTGSVYMVGDTINNNTYADALTKYTDKTGVALEGNMAMFVPTKDGTYTVTYTASLNGQTATASYTIKAGDVVAPAFTADIGFINSTLSREGSHPSTSVGAKFDFARIIVQDTSNTGYTYSKQLISPEGDVVFTVTTADRINNGNSYELTSTGLYQVVYSVTDEVGNTSTLKYTVVVTSTSGNISSDAVTTLAVVLIVVGVILVAGVIIYMIRFRKRKTSKY